MSDTKIITGKVRFSYVNIFKSRAFQAGQDAKYSICLLIPKEDKATIKKIRAAINAAVQDGIASKWGGKKPGNLKLPLRDGDAERADEAPEYEGMYFLNCNSNQKPGHRGQGSERDPGTPTRSTPAAGAAPPSTSSPSTPTATRASASA